MQLVLQLGFVERVSSSSNSARRKVAYCIRSQWLRSKVHMTTHQNKPFLLKIEQLSCFNSNWRQKCPSTLIVEIKTSVVLALQRNHNPRLVPLPILSALLLSLLGRTRFRGRCWAAILLSHRPETSDRAVCGEVDGLDSEGQHCRRIILPRHTYRPQRKPYPICAINSGNDRQQCGGG